MRFHYCSRMWIDVMQSTSLRFIFLYRIFINQWMACETQSNRWISHPLLVDCIHWRTHSLRSLRMEIDFPSIRFLSARMGFISRFHFALIDQHYFFSSLAAVLLPFRLIWAIDKEVRSGRLGLENAITFIFLRIIRNTLGRFFTFHRIDWFISLWNEPTLYSCCARAASSKLLHIFHCASHNADYHY